MPQCFEDPKCDSGWHPNPFTAANNRRCSDGGPGHGPGSHGAECAYGGDCGDCGARPSMCKVSTATEIRTMLAGTLQPTPSAFAGSECIIGAEESAARTTKHRSVPRGTAAVLPSQIWPEPIIDIGHVSDAKSRIVLLLERTLNVHVSTVTLSEPPHNCPAYFASSNCDWTATWSCPRSPSTGRRGTASDDGTAAFFCCCVA